MSIIVGPDGKTPINSESSKKSFKAGGLRFDTTMTPDMLLSKSLAGAQQAIAQQVYSKILNETNLHTVAQLQGEAAAASVSDPFALEPAAMAVFMYLSREIEHRDGIISQLNDRLVKLGSEPLDLSHKYPVPDNIGENKDEPNGKRSN